MTEKPQQTNWALVVLVALGLFYVANNWKKPEPKPPSVDPYSVVSKAVHNQASSFARVFREVSEKVKAGEVDTGEKLFAEISPQLKSEREKAFAEVDQLIQEKLPRGEGDKLGDGADRFLDSIGKAFERAGR